MKPRTKTLIRTILIAAMAIFAVFCLIKTGENDKSVYSAVILACTISGGGLIGYGFAELFIDFYEIYIKKY